MNAYVDARLFTPIASALRTSFPGIFVTGEYVAQPPVFPAVSLELTDDYTSTDHLDTSYREKYSTVTFTVNVYSNLETGKKTQARNILKLIDDMMIGFNFIRLSATPVPNMADSTIYRLTAVYRAETDGVTFYRRR